MVYLISLARKLNLADDEVLGANHFTFEGGGGGAMGDFEKKYPTSAYA